MGLCPAKWDAGLTKRAPDIYVGLMELLSPRAREGRACRTRIQRAADWGLVGPFDGNSRAAGVEKVGKAYRSCAPGVSCTQWRRSSQIWTFMGVCCAALVQTTC